MATTPKARALGTALRGAREERKLTTRDLAHRIGRNQGEISRWETGDRTPKPEYVAQVLTAMGIIGDPYDEIMSLAYDTAAPTWVATTLPAQQQQLATFIEMERTAAAVVEVSPLLVPGLLQTRDYAHTIMSDADLPPDDIVTRVAIRMGRRDTITRANPLQYTAFVGELILRQIIGSRSIMVEQFSHLLEMARRPNISIRLMPFDKGWHPGMESPFILIQPQDSMPIVHLELRRSSTFLHEEDVVSTYVQALGKINGVALTAESSARLIADRMENLS